MRPLFRLSRVRLAIVQHGIALLSDIDIVQIWTKCTLNRVPSPWIQHWGPNLSRRFAATRNVTPNHRGEAVDANARTLRSNLSPSASLAEAVYSPSGLIAVKPSSSTDFSVGFRTPNRQSRLIFLRMAHSSPKLWTLKIWYGSRNSNVSRSAYEIQRRAVLGLASNRREGLISNSRYRGSNPFAPARQCAFQRISFFG